MQLNKKATYPTDAITHEGGQASTINAEQQLRRSVLSCLLFENNAYEDGQQIADRIKKLVSVVDPLVVSKLAVEAREKMGLRHIPLLLLREMARLPNHKRYVARTLERIITRPDQMTDFLALYWSDNGDMTLIREHDGSTRFTTRRRTLSAKVKQGLARAFEKFDEYSLAKYNRLDKEVKLRDVLFLCHAKPRDEAQEALWKRLINNELVTPDTWEVRLSSGEDKKTVWLDLLANKKLGALAFIRNLRNMKEAGIAEETVNLYANTLKVDKIFPYQFIAASKEVPSSEPLLERLMLKTFNPNDRLIGKTILLVDNSGSMDTLLTSKSKMKYTDAACALAMIMRERFADVHVYSFANTLTEIPLRRGFALRDAIVNSPTGGTYLGGAIANVYAKHKDAERIIVITDEQSHDNINACPIPKKYLMNVANHKNGVGYGQWIHIDGFSSSLVNWLEQYEREQAKVRANDGRNL